MDFKNDAHINKGLYWY